MLHCRKANLTTKMRDKLLALLFTVSLVLAPATGSVAAAPGGLGTDVVESDDETVAFSEGVVDPTAEVQFDEDGGAVDPALADAEGTTTAVVRLDGADQSQIASLDEEAAVDSLKSHAAASQQDVLRFAAQRDGIEVQERFWILNGVLVEIDTSEVDVRTLSRIQGVERVHANFDVSLPEPERTAGTSVETTDGGDDYATTYGLDQIDAPEVWSNFGTQGEGVGVAVLDTGVDPDHPDIQIEDDNFVAVDSEGNVDNVAPFDDEGHGTHVSGTVAGGNASGEHIGVAPGATLYHAKVLGSGGGGSFAQIAGGMEWAANESGVDVVSMSLGATGFFPELIEPVQNLEAAGKLVVSSSGNSGVGSSGTPGNIYEVMAIGASNADGDIASFSSGEKVDTSADWGADAPADWPDEYYVPDYAAPGAAVKSAQNGGGYTEKSGTSMAAPHFAGAVALMLSAGGDSLQKSTIQEALTETADKPPNAAQDRYGDGIIDVYAATQQVTLNQSITGVVTDESGDPVTGATVTTDQGFETVTDKFGEYTLLAEAGTVEVNVTGFGVENATETVEVADGETAVQNFTVTPALGVDPVTGQTDAVEGGEAVGVTVDVANLESYTAELADGYDEANATLFVDGSQVPFGTTIEFDEPLDGPVTVTVETAGGTTGDLSIVHTFGGLGDTTTVTTGPTEVFADVKRVGVVDDSGEYGKDVAETLRGQLPSNYQVDVVGSPTATDSVGTYDAFVVQKLEETNAAAFTNATSGYEAGVVYLDQYGVGSNGIEARSAAIGDPTEVTEGFDGGYPNLVNYPTDHPIFENVGAGGPIQLHEASFSDRVQFTGTEANVLADVSAGSNGDVRGAAVAVDEERWDVLAASLGYTSFVGAGDYLPEADLILGNAVEVAANPPGPAGNISVTNATVTPTQNSTVTVETSVENVSGYEVTLEFDPQKLQVDEVTGIDMADPVVDVDNQAGEVVLTQAQATPVDGAQFAQVDFETVGLESGESATIEVDEATSRVYDTNGSAYITDVDDGAVDVLEAELGDVNADGAVTAGDAVIVQRYIAGLPTETDDSQIAALADVNQDGAVTSADVTAILQMVAGGDDASDADEESSDRSETNVDAPTATGGATAVDA